MSGFLINPYAHGVLGTLGTFAGAVVRKAADQTSADFATLSTNLITWGTTVYDTNSFSDGSTKLVIPAEANGYYVIIQAQISLDSLSAGTNYVVEMFKNGAIFNGHATAQRSSGAGAHGVATKAWVRVTSHPIQVSTGDYFEISINVSSDTSVTLVAAESSFGLRIINNSIEGCLLRNASDLTTQNYSTSPAVSFDTEIYDSHALHDPGTNPSRITIPAGLNGRYGIFRASAKLTLVGTTSHAAAIISKNGTLGHIGGSWQAMQNGASLEARVCTQTHPILLTTSEYYEMNISCSDTSTTNVANSTFFSLEVLPASPKAVLAVLNADVTANRTTPTAIAWNGADIYDTDAAHDPASNNTKIIIPSAWNNKYVVFTANTMGNGDLTAGQSTSTAILKAASTSYNGFGGSGGHNGSYAAPIDCAVTQPILVATGEEYTAVNWNNSDTSVTLESNSTSGACAFSALVVSQ